MAPDTQLIGFDAIILTRGVASPLPLDNSAGHVTHVVNESLSAAVKRVDLDEDGEDEDEEEEDEDSRIGGEEE